MVSDDMGLKTNSMNVIGKHGTVNAGNWSKTNVPRGTRLVQQYLRRQRDGQHFE